MVEWSVRSVCVLEDRVRGEEGSRSLVEVVEEVIVEAEEIKSCLEDGLLAVLLRKMSVGLLVGGLCGDVCSRGFESRSQWLPTDVECGGEGGCVCERTSCDVAELLAMVWVWSGLLLGDVVDDEDDDDEEEDDDEEDEVFSKSA